MKEILRNGPINSEFEAPGVFATYSQGLLSQDGFESLKAKAIDASDATKASNISQKTLHDQGLAWTNLNHSIMIVGWGVDDSDKKYWIARNSYGKKWGMDGDFYIRRGKDDFGIESEQVAFEVELL